jgi:2'-5' RNA ligase
MTRTFIAVELDEGARDALRREIARLRAALPGVRFVDPASLHLTLAFLGELGDERLAVAITATEETAHGAHPFTVEINGIGTFGAPQAPRVVWAGLAGDISALLAVRTRLARALAARDFPLEDRPFSPHLTLARLKDRLDADSALRLDALVRQPSGGGTPLPVEALAVMKSELSRSGARYTRLRACRLATG